MGSGTKIHNEICRKFKKEDYSKEFIKTFTQEGCKRIKNITLEDVVSNNNILIGYCDVVIVYEDEGGNEQKLLIEVKSSADAISKDSNNVLRQIKKYRFYNKKFTKTFLIYSGGHIENTNLFTDEDITVLNINDFIDSAEKKVLEQKNREMLELKERESEERKERESLRRERESKKTILCIIWFLGLILIGAIIGWYVILPSIAGLFFIGQVIFFLYIIFYFLGVLAVLSYLIKD